MVMDGNGVDEEGMTVPKIWTSVPGEGRGWFGGRITTAQPVPSSTVAVIPSPNTTVPWMVTCMDWLVSC